MTAETRNGEFAIPGDSPVDLEPFPRAGASGRPFGANARMRSVAQAGPGSRLNRFPLPTEGRGSRGLPRIAALPKFTPPPRRRSQTTDGPYSVEKELGGRNGGRVCGKEPRRMATEALTRRVLPWKGE